MKNFQPLLITLFFLEVIIGSSISAATIPELPFYPGQSQEHVAIVAEYFTVKDFRTVRMEVEGDLIITQGEREALSIEGTKNQIDWVQARVLGGVLTIKANRILSKIPISGGNTNRRLTFRLTVLDLKRIDFLNNGTLQIRALRTPQFTLRMNGIATGVITLYTRQTDIQMADFAKLQVDGATNDFRITAGGNSKFLGQGFKSIKCNVDARGSSWVYVYAHDVLRGDIRDNAKLFYVSLPKDYEVKVQNIATSSQLAEEDVTPSSTSGNLPYTWKPRTSGLNMTPY